MVIAHDAQTIKRAGRVRWVVLDSDGVLTDGRIVIGAQGEDLRAFDVRDGHGVRMGREVGIEFAVVSGRRSSALARRMEELGITEIHQGIHDKLSCLNALRQRVGAGVDELCFMGDDLIDVAAMRSVGLAAAPADAVAEVRAVAHVVTERRGGRGAVRELIDLLLHASGRWSQATSRYGLVSPGK